MTHIELYQEQKLRSDLMTPGTEHDIRYGASQDKNGVLVQWVSIDGIRYMGSSGYEASGDFRWRMIHTNGNVVAASTEGYPDASDMLWNLQFVTGGRFDHGGTVLKRRRSLLRATRAWEVFEIRDLTKEMP